MTTFLKDDRHGPHGEFSIHLANCYLGPQSHRALEVADNAQKTSHKLGPSFPEHRYFGNAAVQGRTATAIAEIINADHSDITLIPNTREGLMCIMLGLDLQENETTVLYNGEYLDTKTPFINRDGSLYRGKTIFVDGEKDSQQRPLGFDLDQFAKAIGENETELVVLSHVQFSNGFTSDLKALAKICNDNAADLVVDVAQSFGVMPIDVKDLGVSALVCPLWKWAGGIRGTGFMYTSKDFRTRLRHHQPSSSGLEGVSWDTDVAQATIRTDAGRFTTSTLATEALIPTAFALESIAKLGVDKIQTEVHSLHDRIRAAFDNFDGISICDAQQPTSFIALTLDNLYGRELDVVNRCTKLELPVHITARNGFIRLAPHHFTSEDRLLSACASLKDIVSELS